MIIPLIGFMIGMFGLYLAGSWFVFRYFGFLSRPFKDLLSVSFGISIYTYLVFIVGRWSLFFAPAVILVLALCSFIRNKKNLLPGIYLSRRYISLLAGLFLLSIILSLPIITSHVASPDGLVFRSHNFADGLWHMALIKQISQNMPPIHPSNFKIAGFNYNYFFDIWGSYFYRYFKVEISVFYFIFYPLTIALYFNSLVYLILRHFMGRMNSFLGVVFTSFGGTLAYMMVWLPSYQAKWNESSFWVSQTDTMLINPPFALSLVIIISLFPVFLNWSKNRTSISPVGIMAMGLMLASLLGIKAYAGMIALGGLAAVVLCHMKDKQLWRLLVSALAFSLLILLFFDKSKFPFFVKPFWFIKTMFEASDRAYNPSVLYREAIYQMTHQTLKLVIIRIYKFLVFLLGNFSFRILGFGALWMIFRKRLPVVFGQWLAAMSLLGILAPLLLLQGGVVWNTIQFSYYALVFLSLLLLIVLNYWFKNKTSWVIVLIIGLTLPTTVKSLWDLKTGEKTVISHAEMAAISWVKDNIDEKETVVLELTARSRHYLYVSALAQKRVNYASAHQSELFNFPAKTMEEELTVVFQDKTGLRLKKYMYDHSFHYLYLTKYDTATAGFDFTGFEPVFENEDVAIYKLT